MNPKPRDEFAIIVIICCIVGVAVCFGLELVLRYDRQDQQQEQQQKTNGDHP